MRASGENPDVLLFPADNCQPTLKTDNTFDNSTGTDTDTDTIFNNG
jgi:hypothetical protein